MQWTFFAVCSAGELGREKIGFCLVLDHGRAEIPDRQEHAKRENQNKHSQTYDQDRLDLG
jgi:hypothetical protein